MDHTDLEEQQIVERYLMGRLSAAETERFEEHYLTCGECVDRLETAERLRQALKGVAAEEAAAATFAGAGILAALRRLGRSGRAALGTALLVVALLPTVLLVRAGGERDRLAAALGEARQPQANTSLLRLSPVRSGPGEAPAVRLTLSPEPQWIVLSLDVGGDGPFRATLSGPRGGTVWQDSGFEPGPTGAVVLSVHSSSLGAGDYLLEIAPAGGTAAGARFSFRVIREDSAAGGVK